MGLKNVSTLLKKSRSVISWKTKLMYTVGSFRPVWKVIEGRDRIFHVSTYKLVTTLDSSSRLKGLGNKATKP